MDNNVKEDIGKGLFVENEKGDSIPLELAQYEATQDVVALLETLVLSKAIEFKEKEMLPIKDIEEIFGIEFKDE